MVLAQLGIPSATIQHLGKIASAGEVPFMLDPAPAFPLGHEFCRAVTWLTPNESEACILLGRAPGELHPGDAPAIVKELLALGARNVALKLGADGVYLAGEDVRPVHVPAFDVEATDTIAAGDAFNGAFAYALVVCRMVPAAAAEFACGVAALSVTRSGAQASMPSLAEVEVFLAKYTSKRAHA